MEGFVVLTLIFPLNENILTIAGLFAKKDFIFASLKTQGSNILVKVLFLQIVMRVW